jgi:polyhydroxyalkanoate synthesis regulator phasin
MENPWGSKYNDSMCLEIIGMYSQGKTRAQFCAKHTICNDTFEKWRKRHPLFNRSCEIAHDKARGYFDELRDSHLEQEIDLDTKSMTGINHALFNRMYNTRFNIPDKRAVKIKGLGKAKDEKTMLKALMNAIEDGQLTPDEAQKLASLIDLSIKIDQNVTQEKRLCAVEQAQRIGSSEDGFEEVAGI